MSTQAGVIELRALGTLDLRVRGGPPTQSVLAQPKRTALLVYLALARPHGMHQRETLAGLFWGEMDGERARKALRQALYYLRGSVGEDALVAIGDTEVGISRERVWCDAVEMERALEEGRAEDALALYAGELLPGFYLEDASGFERWLEEERAWLRGRAAEAAWRVAGHREAAGDAGGAAHWARRAAAYSPGDEIVIRRLMALLERVGDRAAAIRAYEAFAWQLEQEYELDPSAETRALLEAIRNRRETDRGRPGVQPPIASAAISSSVDAPQDRLPGGPVRVGVEETGAAPAPAPSKLRSHVGVIASLLFAFAVAVTARGRVVRSAPDRALPISSSRVAIFPFDVQGRPEFSYLDEGLMDLLSDAIDGVGDIRSADPFAIATRLRRAGATEVADLDLARAVARDLGAGRFVVGRVIELGGALRVSASLYRTEGSGEPHRILDERPIDALPELITNVARGLISGLPTGQGEWLSAVAAAPTASYPALRAFARGEALVRRARYDSAVSAFQTAVAEDSTFSLAWLRLAFAANFAGPDHDGLIIAATDHLTRHENRLSARDRGFAATAFAMSRGDWRGVERHARAQVSAYPESVQGWFGLGGGQFWSSWQQGLPPDRAEAALQRARQLDPDHPQVLHLLGWISYLRGHPARADSLIRQAWDGANPFLMPPEEEPERSAFWDRLVHETPARLIEAALNTAAFSDSLDAAVRIAAYLHDPQTRQANVSAAGHMLEAFGQAAAGRFEAAEAALARAGTLAPGIGVLERSWLAALPFREIGRDRVSALRDSLMRWQPSVTGIGNFGRSRVLVLSEPAWLAPHAWNYVLGLLSACLADEASALRYADLLTAAGESSDSIGLLHDLALEIRALLALRSGNPKHALVALQQLELRVASHYQSFASAVHMRPLARLLRAEAFFALERWEEAAGWYDGLGWAGGIEVVMLAHANRRLGEIQERLGRPSRACYHYQRFGARWRSADAEYRDQLQVIGARLDHLGRMERVTRAPMLRRG